MIRNLSIICLMLSLFIGCWDKKKDDGSAFLDDDYDFIFGILVPNDDRNGPTEIYVGRILDRDVDHGGPDHIIPINEFGIQDSFHLNQVWYYQTEYRAPIANIDDASVVIISDDQTVTLQSVGKGVYRDVNNLLNIKANNEYELQVNVDGKAYSAKTKIPENISLTNVLFGDTIEVYGKKNTSADYLCGNDVWVRNNAPTGSLLFRSEWKYSGGIPYQRGAFASTIDSTFGVVIQVNENYPGEAFYQDYQYEVFAMDTALSNGYVSEGISGTWSVFRFLEDNFTNGIANRSNIKSTHGKVAGTFGSYNAVRTEFTVKLLLDSCQCVFNFPCELGKNN